MSLREIRLLARKLTRQGNKAEGKTLTALANSWKGSVPERPADETPQIRELGVRNVGRKTQPISETTTVGANLRRLREGKGLSDADLARLAGLNSNSRSTISRIERGANVSPHMLQILADALGVPISELTKPPTRRRAQKSS